jgi:hypothetical protein
MLAFYASPATTTPTKAWQNNGNCFAGVLRPVGLLDGSLWVTSANYAR